MKQLQTLYNPFMVLDTNYSCSSLVLDTCTSILAWMCRSITSKTVGQLFELVQIMVPVFGKAARNHYTTIHPRCTLIHGQYHHANNSCCNSNTLELAVIFCFMFPGLYFSGDRIFVGSLQVNCNLTTTAGAPLMLQMYYRYLVIMLYH